MTTLVEIEAQLPWGFHDAFLEGVSIDWLRQTLDLVMRVPVSKDQSEQRRAQVSVWGLFFCSIDPPSLADPDFVHVPREGLWIDARPGPGQGAVGLPDLPEGVFLHHLQVRSWNSRTIHIAGRDARLVWLD